ncbi:MAG: OmpA family protein [Treponema sp.]|jgi:outer membrane protein OmpA-like peptidoglycan-associated protein|nr:OmpA family protein [Treponema sp.]
MLVSAPALKAEEAAGAAVLARGSAGPYKTIERSDLSRYDNGKYIGHMYREVRATLNPRPLGSAQGVEYQGNFFVLEETLRDMRQSARAVDAVLPVTFQIFPDGNLRIEDDQGFPALRGFPAFPLGPVRPGVRWTAQGVRVVDPLNEGLPVAVPIIAEYEYQGTETYRDIPVHRISARYASRYSGPPPGAKPGARYFTGLQGSHSVEILLRVADGLPLLMRDNLDETYSWPGGETVRFRGFTLTFGEGTVPLNQERIIATIGRNLNGGAGSGGSPSVPSGGAGNGSGISSGQSALETGANIDLAAVPGGIRLTVKDLRFAPDSDEFLPAEYSRLDRIAAALKEAPDRSFLVEGHTAAVGRPQGEMELSVQRAKRMVDELVKRGISADRFLYKGWGGTRPLRDNATEEGRAQNRRVEITILE